MNSPSQRDHARHGFALAGGLFLVSLLLPAVGIVTDSGGSPVPMEGWRCAQFVATYFFEFLSDSFNFKKDFAGWFYYSAFNVTNLALLALPIMSFTKRFGQFSSLLPWFVGTCFLHTASWWFSEKQQILAGYYVWLLAVGVLFAACVARVRSQNIPLETKN